MKPRIHYYSDCPFFAGCENMLINFFSSDKLREDFEISFSYRYSREYEEGMSRRLKTDLDKFPINLLDVGAIAQRIRSRSIRIVFRITALLLLIRYWFILYNTLLIWRYFGKLGHIDLLHVNNGGFPAAYSCFSAVYAAKLRGVKNIVFVVNNVARPYSITRWLDFPFDRLVARYTDIFVTGSKFAGLALKNVLKLPSDKLVNIHNGICLREMTETRRQTFERLQIPEKSIVISVVAVLESRKGHIYLLKAMQELQKEKLSSMPILLVEGTGGLLNSLMNYVDENNLHNCVKFIGNEENVINLLNASDIVVLPSIENEDFPNIVIEAMGLGGVVIASRLCGTPEQIDHEKNGILVKPGNVKQLASSIKRIVENPKLRKQLSIAAAAKFGQSFTDEVAVKKYLDLYKERLGN